LTAPSAVKQKKNSLNLEQARVRADWFARRRPEAQARKLIHQLNVLGYTVSLSPIDRAA